MTAANSAALSAAANPKTPRILIVEDSIVSAMMMEATINRKKPEFAVRIRKSLKGGFEEAATFEPDLVILDLTLPDSPEGAEALQAIPALRRKSCLIAFSGRSDLQEAALAAGANEFWLKGIGEDPQPFIERITALLPKCIA